MEEKNKKMNNSERVKGFISMTVGAVLGGHAIQAVGNIGHGMSAGMKSTTQSMIGIGVLGSGGKMWKW